MLRNRRATPRTNASEEQFQALIADHAEVIYRVAYSVVRDEHLAEDIVQETIIKAWQALPSWRGDGSLRGWVLSIAHNTAVSYLRRMRDTSTEPARLPERASSADVERETDARADLDRLRLALAEEIEIGSVQNENVQFCFFHSDDLKLSTTCFNSASEIRSSTRVCPIFLSKMNRTRP